MGSLDQLNNEVSPGSDLIGREQACEPAPADSVEQSNSVGATLGVFVGRCQLRGTEVADRCEVVGDDGGQVCGIMPAAALQVGGCSAGWLQRLVQDLPRFIREGAAIP